MFDVVGVGPGARHDRCFEEFRFEGGRKFHPARQTAGRTEDMPDRVAFGIGGVLTDPEILLAVDRKLTEGRRGRRIGHGFPNPPEAGDHRLQG